MNLLSSIARAFDVEPTLFVLVACGFAIGLTTVSIGLQT